LFQSCTNVFQSKKSSDDSLHSVSSLPVGTVIEFDEKGRVHMGRIIDTVRNIGGARYTVIDEHGKQFSIADRQVAFSIPAHVNGQKALLEFDQLCAVHVSSEQNLRERLDVSADLLEMVWEEILSSSSNDNDHDTVITPSTFVDLLHSHSADHIEVYTAWRFLRTDLAHVFFKELKDHGRVVSFKAKDNKAVEAAKVAFCQSHNGDDDFCYVGLRP
jgi:hypothetical protein